MASSTYRDEALARLDFRAFYEQRLELRRISGEEYRFHCPFHEDDQASANVNLATGLWFCHACNVGGSPLDFRMQQGLDFKTALAEIGKAAGMPEPVSRRTNGAGAPRPAAAHPPGDQCLTQAEAKIPAWHEAALRNADLMHWFSDTRGFTRDTIDAWQLGWDGSRVTIPIRDRDGVLVNVRKYKRNSRSVQGKMIGINQHNEAALFPEQALDTDDPLLVEGEWDALLLHQHGFINCLTVTSGAGIWKPHFTPLFTGKNVTVMYDNDSAGRQGSERVARLLAPVAGSVAVAVIPGLGDKQDVTDFFVERQRDAAELRLVIADAVPWIVQSKVVGPAIELTLPQASDAARYDGQQITMPVLVSGKLTRPYTVPSRFTVHCDMNNTKLCPFCPLYELSGRNEVTLSASDPKVLRLINVSDKEQRQAQKELATALPNCTHPIIETHARTNIEELRLIPELDTASDGGDTEYVSRTGYLIGHGLRTNRGYRVTGYTHHDPKDQGTVHLLDEAIPAQDNIGSFVMTPELYERLAILQGDPTAIASQVYDDLRNVHRIRGRPDMQVAFDLVWHSVIAFNFNNEYVRRGWVEGLIVSDSGQAKSGMAMSLLKHYGLGERVQSENATLAGLIGGLEKMGDNWILTWGKVPLNDKRLLIIDECQALKSGQIEAMSDVRATGEAELTKIRTERTNARCRIMWLANSSTGKQLSSYNQGVLALRDVFSKPEDIRRLDFVLGLASGDIDSSVINQVSPAAEQPRFSSEICRNLILWAWSRRPDQVTFTPAATTTILAHATDFAARYHSSIPIVEPADQRLKLARLSAAMAARMFSTPDGEQLVVDVPHVEFVVNYLHRIYNARALSYGEYSDQQRGGETLRNPDVIWAELSALDNADSLITWLRQATVFKRQELEDGLALDASAAKQVVKTLTRLQLVRSGKQGYTKLPAFITLLRDRASPDLGDLPWEDAD